MINVLLWMTNLTFYFLSAIKYSRRDIVVVPSSIGLDDHAYLMLWASIRNRPHHSTSIRSRVSKPVIYSSAWTLWAPPSILAQASTNQSSGRESSISGSSSFHALLVAFQQPLWIPNRTPVRRAPAALSRCSTGIAGWVTLGSQEALTAPALRSSRLSFSTSKGPPRWNID